MDATSQIIEGAPATTTGDTSSPSWDRDAFTRDIIEALRTVHDPEIPLNIFDLGLVYRIDVNELGIVGIDMTLTAPGCPVAGEMLGWVKTAVSNVEGVTETIVNLVFDPPWDQSRMSEEAKLELGLT